MAKKNTTRNKSKNLNFNKESVDKEVKKAGLTYATIAGVVIAIIGMLLILFNLSGVLEAFIGFVLIYFGLKILGYHLSFW